MTAVQQRLELGDVDGHVFHGNQWTGSKGQDARNERRARVKADREARTIEAEKHPLDESITRLQAALPDAIIAIAQMDPHEAKFIADRVEAFAKEYPKAASVIHLVTMRDLTQEGDVVANWSARLGRISFNSRYYGDAAEERRTGMNMTAVVSGGPFHREEGLGGVVDHELGHVLDSASLNEGTIGVNGAALTYRDRLNLLDGLGTYSMKNASEAFAEAFSQSRRGVCCVTDAMQQIIFEAGQRTTARAALAFNDPPADPTCEGYVPPQSVVSALEFGDVEGHDFHGNQWTGSRGGARPGSKLPGPGEEFESVEAARLAVRDALPNAVVYTHNVPPSQLDLVSASAHGLIDLAAKFPKAAAELRTVTFDGVASGDGVLGSVWPGNVAMEIYTGELELFSFDGDPKEAVQRGEDAAVGFRYGPMDWEKVAYATSVHEFGHVIDEAADRRGVHVEDVIDSKMTYDDFDRVEKFSSYARNNPAEAFAEAFAAQQLGVKGSPRVLSNAVKQLEATIASGDGVIRDTFEGSVIWEYARKPVTASVWVNPLTAGAEEGHSFQGNQWTTGQHEKVQRPSKFVAPDGDPMTRNQIGDTMEALAAHHPAISAALAERFGGPVRAVRGEQAGSNRAGPWDLEAGNSGIELKSIHAESSQIKIRMKTEEIEDKKVEIVKAGLEPATAALVWQPTGDGGATAHVFAIDGVASGSLQKFDNLGSFAVTPAQYREAFTTAGYGNALQAAGQLMIEFGDTEGHPFHGNQWTGGRGGEDAKAAERAAIQAKIDAAMAAGLTTEDLYDKGKFGAEGLWSPEREAMHEEIVHEILDANAHVPKDAQAIIMGGLMGAGKSTIIRDEKSGIDASQYLTVNPDDIKNMMIDRGMLPPVKDLDPQEMAGLIHEESSKIALDLAEHAQRDGTNVLWDISMSSPRSIVSRVQELTDDLGPKYNTKMVFVDIPLELAQQRALSRYEQGGRYMDPDLLASFANEEWGSKNRMVFEMTKDHVNEWQLWDNSRDFDPRLVASATNYNPKPAIV